VRVHVIWELEDKQGGSREVEPEEVPFLGQYVELPTGKEGRHRDPFRRRSELATCA
jgi:hypothetical protein